MCAKSERDGRSVEYRWGPLFKAAKCGWRPLLECHAVTLPRHETRWNSPGSPPLVGRRLPYCEDMWRRYCCLVSVFRLSIYAFSPTRFAMVLRWRFLAIFESCISSEPRTAHFRPAFYIRTKGHIMCGSTVDIQFPTAENSRGKKKKKEKKKNKLQDENGLPYSIGRP